MRETKPFCTCVFYVQTNKVFADFQECRCLGKILRQTSIGRDKTGGGNDTTVKATERLIYTGENTFSRNTFFK